MCPVATGPAAARSALVISGSFIGGQIDHRLQGLGVPGHDRIARRASEPEMARCSSPLRPRFGPMA